MKKQWFYLMGLLIVMPFFSRSQICTWTDSTDFLPETDLNYACYFPVDSYIPTATDSILTINVCLIIGQNQSGNSNFSDNKVTDSTDFFNALYLLNKDDFNNLPAPNVPNPNALFNVVDTRIRFRLARVWYVQANASGRSVVDSIISYVPPEVRRNKLLVVHTSKAYMGLDTTGTLPNGIGVAMRTIDDPANRTLSPAAILYEHRNFYGLDLLAHEIGHALNLKHTHDGNGNSTSEKWDDGDNINDTPDDIFTLSDTACAPLPAGCGCPPVTIYPNNECPENYMSYHAQNWWSPRQVGRMRKKVLEDHPHILHIGNASANGSGFVEISTNTIWSGYKPVKTNIRVKSGSTLTIQDATVVLTKDATIEVEPNAKLVIQCSRLSGTQDFWTGIRLLGDHTQPQTSQYQAELEIHNSRIAYAADAVFNGNILGNCAVIPSAGIVEVDSSVFYNNLRHVALNKYDPSPNLSYGHWLADWIDYKADFKDSYFRNDYYLLNPQGQHRGAAVSLWGVHGVKFENCFFDQQSKWLLFNPAMPNEAIFLLDASVNLTNSKVWHFKYGLRSLTSKPIFKGSKLLNNEFKYNRFGVYTSGSRLNNFVKNEFHIIKDLPGVTSNGVDVPYGLYLDHSGTFTAEENKFFSTFTFSQNFSLDPAATRVGLVVNNNADYNDVLYNNLVGANLGIELLGQNRDQNGINGLQCKCNEFGSTSTTNIYVKGTLNNSLDGIRENQGDVSPNPTANPLSQDLAGNLFANGSNHIWDFNNENTPNINYHHHDNSNPNVEPTPSQGPITPKEYSVTFNSNACPTRLIVQPESGDTLPELDYPLAQAETDFEQHTAEADSLEVVLHQLVDGGNTYALQGEIYFTPQHEHFELYSSLIDESPYLSDAVLTDIIELDGFDELMLRNVLVANPQSAKNQQLMDLLGEEHPDMPQYMIDDIKTGQDNFGAMELVEGDLAYHRQRQHFAAKRLLDLYVNDENHFSEAEEAVRHLLRQLRTPSFQYMRAQMELELGNLTEARQVIDSVPLLCALQDDEALVHARAESYFDLQFDRAGNEQAVCDYSPAQLQSLQNLSAGDHIAGAWSRATLELLGQAVTYQEPLYLPGTVSGKRAEVHQFPQVARPLNRLYPNPARKQVSVGLGEIPLARKVEVQLFDLSGRQVKSQPMAGAETQVSLKGIAPGTYLLGVYADGNRIFEDKLIILE